MIDKRNDGNYNIGQICDMWEKIEAQWTYVRKMVDLDRFRAPGYFDDVSVILCSKDQETIPEGVWIRLEDLPGDDTSFQGTLLNEPYPGFGVHEVKMLTGHFAEHEEGRFLVAEDRSE